MLMLPSAISALAAVEFVDMAVDFRLLLETRPFRRSAL